MLRVLYISYWGALEQLGQSLVVPAVGKLSQMGVDLTLITFEKPDDMARTDEMKKMRRMLEANKVTWLPLQYHKTPRIPATVFDITQGIVRSLQKRLAKRFDIVHARTFISGLIGLLLAPLINAKFIYHNEGFYPDELVDSNVWAKGSRSHRIAKSLENSMYSRADGIIALSFQSKKEIENLPRVKAKKTPVIVVPSCVDLEKFQLPKEKPKFSENEVRFVYIGSVGGRYLLDKIGEFVSTLRDANKNVSLQIYSKTSYEEIEKILDGSGLQKEDWSLKALDSAEVPERLAGHQVGIHFLRAGISEHSGSPTKIGEYWAVGLPVVVTPNMSDNDAIIDCEKVGVIVENHTREVYLRTFQVLERLLESQDISIRCRQTAEKYYSLDDACQNQFLMYKSLSD